MSENQDSDVYFQKEQQGERQISEKVSFDSKSNELVIKPLKEKESRHPFQDFLYSLREGGVEVSTSEWIDLQKILKEGEVQSLDDLYIVSRSLLVKDVSDYPQYEIVFGNMFYGLELTILDPDENTEDDESFENYDNDENDEHEETEVKEEIGSQEIVEPGMSEQHHGGDDVHKEIKNSKSSGHEGGGNTINKSHSDKDNSSAKERILERRYDAFNEEGVFNHEQIGRALARLTTIITENSDLPTGKLDTKATVQNIADNAGLPELVWQKETETNPKVILMFDVGGSTDEFRPIMEKLFASAKDHLDDVDVFYFHNAIYGEVWQRNKNSKDVKYIPLEEVLRKDSNSKVIIVGDAWMAYNELWDDFVDYDESTGKMIYMPSGIESLNKIKNTFEDVVWINPIFENKHKEADDSGTIADIKNLIPMYDLSLKGVEKATRRLMEV